MDEERNNYADTDETTEISEQTSDVSETDVSLTETVSLNDTEEGNFNEVETFGDNSEGNFNEIDTISDNSDGNFNEIDTPGDNSDGNFNETDTPGDNNDSNFNEFNAIGNYNNQEGAQETNGIPTDGASGQAYGYNYSPTAAPETTKSSKTLLGVVLALSAVIIGLIIFLVVLLINKNKDNNEPAKSADNGTTTISITPEITDTENPTSAVTNIPDDNGKTEENGNSGEEIPVTAAPTFNVTTELGEYKGLKVDYTVAEVTDEDVEQSLEYFISNLADEEAVDNRPLQEGDIAVIDYTGTMDGEEFEGGSDTDFELELGSGLFIPGFEDGLIGKEVGETVSLDLTFPDPYVTDPDFSGKAVNYQVSITDAYTYVTPELTDEVVAENSDYKTVAELREATKKELEEENIQSADSKMKNDLIQLVIAGSKFSGQIDEQIAYEEQDCIDYYDQMCSQSFGIDGATYFGYVMGITSDQYYAMVHEQAEMSVKFNYILDEIAKKEGFTVSEEEYEAEFQATFLDTYGFVSKEEVFEQISEEEARKIIEGYVLHDKAEKVILDSAVINK